MSFENVRQYFENKNLGERVKELSKSSATVEEAAEAIGCEPERIAKTMSFLMDDRPILIVTAGDARIDNKKYKLTFGQKAKMIPYEHVEGFIGHEPGGVCPFAIKEDVVVYLDVSMKRFDFVYPAAGNSNSAVEISLPELEEHSGAHSWIDVCKGWLDNN